jgi:hypothetical protein
MGERLEEQMLPGDAWLIVAGDHQAMAAGGMLFRKRTVFLVALPAQLHGADQLRGMEQLLSFVDPDVPARAHGGLAFTWSVAF